MSEEEKKSFEELKKEINKPLEVPEDKCNTFILYNIDNAKIIVNLIEKQQKEIENLKEINKEHQKLNGELRKEIEKWKMLATQKLIKNKENCIKIQSQCISKDKIREKIEEYKGLKEIDKMAYEEQIKPLQELLKEE